MFKVIISLVLALMITRPLAAQPNISTTGLVSVPNDGSPRIHVSGSCGTLDDIWDLVIVVDPSFTGGSVTVTHSCSGQSLRNVTFTGNGTSGPLTVVLGASGSLSNRFDSVMSIDASATNRPVRASIFSRELGTVKVNELTEAQVTETLNGPINILNKSGLTSVVDFVNVGATGHQGSITGDIINNYGAITEINCYADGLIGGVGNRVTFRSSSFNGPITAGTVNANFYGPSGGAAPSFYKLSVQDGDFDGEMRIQTIYAPSIGNGIFVTGSGASLNASIVIEQSLLNYANIEVPTGGLAGQVIINAVNSTYTWSGPVKVNGTSVSSPPYYTNESTSIGGGAVGLVPFHLYKTDCSPPDNPDGACGLSPDTKTWPSGFGGETRQTIVLRHYGPVFNSDAENVPLVISRRSIAVCTPTLCDGDEPSWVDRTSLFDVYVPGGGSREVWVAYKLDSGDPVDFDNRYEFSIDLATASGHPLLRSDMTLASPAPDVAGYPYGISPFCPSVPSP